jgi:hypothetical protein
MNRRTFLSTLIVTPAVAALLAACGDDSAGPAGSTPDTTAPGGTTPGKGSGIVHPTGANEAVLRSGYQGGFMTADAVFSQSPSIVISGGGLVLTPGAVPAIYPGPMVMPYFQRTIDEAGVQTVLAAAKDAGLLASAPDYTLPDGIGIADAPDTVLVVNANNAGYEHRAYALDIAVGDGTASTPARDALAGFLAKLGDLETLVGAEHLGAEQPYEPVSYRLRATPVEAPVAAVETTDSSVMPTEPQPVVSPWPAGTGVVLAQASNCVLADGAKVGATLTAANQLTYFSEDGVTYQLAVAIALPGDQPC